MKKNKTNIGGRNVAIFIFKDMGCGTLHHNIPANNALRKKNKMSAIVPI